MRIGSIGIAIAGLLLWLLARPTPPNVIFIVLDTVRADHLSTCGYDRPTSPNLTRIVASADMSTCAAVAPGSWTLPSHASFFTGVDPTEHDAHAITTGITDFAGTSNRVEPLKKGPNHLKTLAEHMVDAGYQTIAVSGNPVLNSKLGLLRGFEVQVFSQKWGDLYGSDLLKVLGATLSRSLDRKRPFFLFVNVADAHQPWSDVPKGHAWLKTPRKSVKYGKVKDDDVWRSYIEGRMGAKQQTRFLNRITDLYDQGVSNADRSLGAIVSRIEEVGICDSGCRWVVTSDHGEFLGEHGLLDHGHYLYEENARVPLVVWGDGLDVSDWPASRTNGNDAPVVSAMQSFYLSRDGQPATPRLPVTSMAWPHVRRCARTQGQAFCTTSAAIWNPNDSSEKLLWADGVSWRIDLDSDPTESNPIPLTDHPLASELQALADKMAPKRTEDETRDPAVTQMLQSLGYLD